MQLKIGDRVKLTPEGHAVLRAFDQREIPPDTMGRITNIWLPRCRGGSSLYFVTFYPGDEVEFNTDFDKNHLELIEMDTKKTTAEVIEEVGELRNLHHVTIMSNLGDPIKIAFIDKIGREKITTSDGSWWNLDGSQRMKRGKLKWPYGTCLEPYLNAHRDDILRYEVASLLDAVVVKVEDSRFTIDQVRILKNLVENTLDGFK